jgi:hypothetical protein
MRRGIAFLLGFLLSAVAWAGGSFILLGKKRPPIDPDEVVIYFDLPARYEKVAVVEGDSMGSFAITSQGKTDKAIQRMKKQAAKLGANAIVLQAQGQQAGGAVIVPSGNGAIAISGGMIKSTSGLAIWEDRSASATTAEATTISSSSTDEPSEQDRKRESE